MNTSNLNALNHDQIVNLMASCIEMGLRQTLMIEGDTGAGKSSLLKMMAAQFPEHIVCYFDATTKTVGDMVYPKVWNGDDPAKAHVTFIPNEEFGLHHDSQPIILMIDEYKKSPTSVKNNLLRVAQEWQLGSRSLPEGSMVFMTSNLSAEGLGDNILPHQMDRMTVVQMRKPTTDEWVNNYAIPNGLNFAVASWAQETPQLGQTFLDVQDPEDNPYIYHPRAADRKKFVTFRGLEKAANWVDMYDEKRIDSHTLSAALVGTLGTQGGRDLAAYIRLCDELPSLQDIMDRPHTAPVPQRTSALLMVVYRTTTTLSYEWVDAWMDYMSRLPDQMQSTFVNRMRALADRKGYKQDPRVKCLFNNSKYKNWCVTNRHMFTADR